MKWDSDLISCFLSSIFIAAALSKLIFINEYPIPDHLVFKSSIVTHLFIQYEFVIGFCLLAKILVNQTRILVLMTLAIFICYHLFSIFYGKPSCSCFGFLKAPTSLMLMFNFFLFSITLFLSPSSNKKMNRNQAFGLSLALITLSVATWLSFFFY